MSNRFLITTAIEETWKYDQPVLLLGEWCRPLNNTPERIHLNVDIITDDQVDPKPLESVIYLNRLHEKLTIALTRELNDLNNIDKSKRFWLRILGWWLKDYIYIQYYHWQLIKRVEELGLVNETIIIRDFEKYLMSKTRLTEAEPQLWFHSSFANIIKNHTKIKYELIDYNQPKNADSFTQGAKTKIIRNIARFCNTTQLINRNDSFFIGLTMPLKEQIKADLACGQFPLSWLSSAFFGIKTPDTPHNSTVRKWSLKIDAVNEFESFIENITSSRIPRDFIENFEAIGKQCEKLPFPESPKQIVTANWPKNDMLLVRWCAEKLEEQECQLNIIQHGGNYGCDQWYVEKYEVDIADRFFSWGWKNEKSKVQPMFFNKRVYQFPKTFKNSKRLSYISLDLLEMARGYNLPLPSRMKTHYKQDINEFLYSIKNDIRKVTWLRGFKNHSYIYEYYKDKYPEVNIDNTFGQKRSVERMVENTRLFVVNYNSTICQEIIASNLPIIMCWKEDLFPIRESAQPFYKLLEEQNIFHSSPESAAKHVNKIWDNVEDWWFNPKTQKVKDVFCENFARRPIDFKKLANTIKNNSFD
jgi:putative transferase (TIGR04331 family)